IFLLAGKNLSHHTGDGIFRLAEGENAQEYDNKKNLTAAFHKSPPQCATSINRQLRFSHRRTGELLIFDF
ncbi:MAG TPA: hypothetical protein VKL99_12075, partial [Candidatus Angelobacter sp.]|nr:hypothetical protein [Candidatus Angelobacter sp.]